MTVTTSARAPAAKSRTSQAHSGYFRTADGVDLYFEDSGESRAAAGRPALVFIYGLGCSILHWKYPRAFFAAQAEPRRQLWMDFRGHGRSRPPRSGQRLSIDLVVDDLVALLRARGVKACVVLGQSMGGSIAMTMAHRHPELVRGLVLLASPSRNPGNHLPLPAISSRLWRGLIALNRRAPGVLQLAYALGEPWRDTPLFKLPMRELVRHLGFNPKLARTDDIEEYISKVFAVSPRHFYDMAEDLSDFDVGQLEPKLHCPSLVLAGANDQVVPLAEMRYLMSHLPAGQLVVLPHGSHCPHFDDPGTVNHTIAAFLASSRL